MTRKGACVQVDHELELKNGNLERTIKILNRTRAKKMETVAKAICHRKIETVKSKVVLKEGKYMKNSQSQRRKILFKEGAVSILGNIINHKEGNFFSRRKNFHFGLSDARRETTY